MDSKIAYHLRELEIACDPASPHYAAPEFLQDDQVILDIGCGIGQTLAGSRLKSKKLLIGIDIDLDCINYGRHHFNDIRYVNGIAEHLPFQDNSFDLVISRVALPYTDIPKSLAEIARVLKDDGRVWLTMHSFSMVGLDLKGSVRKLEIKDVIYRIYVLVNGMIFHLFGKLFRFPLNKRCESFQTGAGMEACMTRMGFTDISVKEGNHFICTARKHGITKHRA